MRSNLRELVKREGKVILGYLCLLSRTDDKTILLSPKITGKRQFENCV